MNDEFIFQSEQDQRDPGDHIAIQIDDDPYYNEEVQVKKKKEREKEKHIKFLLINNIEVL